MNLTGYFEQLVSGDLAGVRTHLDSDPYLANVRNPDADAWDESTPLHAAAKHGHLDTVRLLVDAGAEVYTNPMASYPPVIVAAWNKQQEVVDYFLKEIPDKASGMRGVGVSINLAARQGWTELVRRHIEIDPLAVHQRGWIGDSPLHWPAHNGDVETVELLLDAGADIEADEVGWAGGKPLHWASEHEPATTKLLLDRGAEVDSRNAMAGDRLGFTPLMMNASQKNDCAEVTEMLLKAGADPKATDAKERTALEIAEETGLKRIPEILRNA